MIDLRVISAAACGFVDIAPPTELAGEPVHAMPTTPQANTQQTVDNRP